jgi:hypothetical protein
MPKLPIELGKWGCIDYDNCQGPEEWSRELAVLVLDDGRRCP